jgi:hypothetical protein
MFLAGDGPAGVLVLSGSSGRVEEDRCRVLAAAGATAASYRWFGRHPTSCTAAHPRPTPSSAGSRGRISSA